jgi:hypothetical protein
MRRLLIASVGLALVLLTPAAAAQEGFLVTFHFDTLWFKFHPLGLASTKAKGSGIEVFAQNVNIAGDEVKDLRHCIDGWGEPDCSYGNLLQVAGYEANKDGQVTAQEVADFKPFALLGAGQIPKIQRLSQVLKDNVTVDGVAGGTPRVVELDFREAEGGVDDTAPAHADVKVEVGYENDRNAKHHEIHMHDLGLQAEGFLYNEVRWTLEDDPKWDYKPDQTLPGSVKGRVTKDGWTSNQGDFESATNETLRLVVELPKKKTPGPEALAILGAVAVALVLVVRRR